MAWICGAFLWSLCLRWSLTSESKSNFWLLKTWLWPPAFWLARFDPLWYLLVTKNKIAATKALFPACPWNSKTITGHSTWDFKKVIFSSTSIYSRNAGLTVWTWKLTALKGTTTSNARKYIFCYWISSETNRYTFIISKWCKDRYTLQPLQCQGLGRVVLSIWSFMCFIKSALVILYHLFFTMKTQK